MFLIKIEKLGKRSPHPTLGYARNYAVSICVAICANNLNLAWCSP